MAAPSVQAQGYTYDVMYTFTGSPDGANPAKNLVRDAQGNLYGTTSGGGASGDGTVFKVDTTGKETVLYSFTGIGGDGKSPHASLVLDAKGNLYGTTMTGGAGACSRKPTCGTVFEFDTTTGKETVLFSFTDAGGGGANPEQGLVLDAKGNLYGMTPFGGSGYGTVFMLAPPTKSGGTWTETKLYSFCAVANCADGGMPGAGLVRDAQGNLFGTTTGGGDVPCNPAGTPPGCGVVFKLAPPAQSGGAWTETVVHSFTGADGAIPFSDLLLDTKGNLYGTTYMGGDISCNAPEGCGTVFKVDSTGKESVLYSFTGTGGDGEAGVEGVVLDTKGNLYGTTYFGGDLSCPGGTFHGGNFLGCGTVFKRDTTGKETVLHTFTGTGGDGAVPYAGLVRDTAGNLYGTAAGGGDFACNATTGCGIVFKLAPAAATTTTLSSSLNPSTYGQAVTFTAVVASKSGTPPNGETVTFMSGKTALGTGTLSGGAAKFTTSTLKAGTMSVTAVYAGDASFAASTSKAVKQVVGKATTTTAVVSSANPSSVGQSVTFTATVTPEFGGTVTGKVAFYDGTTLLKSVAVSGGAAKFTTTKLTFRQAYDHGDIRRQHEFHRQFGCADADSELGKVKGADL